MLRARRVSCSGSTSGGGPGVVEDDVAQDGEGARTVIRELQNHDCPRDAVANEPIALLGAMGDADEAVLTSSTRPSRGGKNSGTLGWTSSNGSDS